MKTQTLSQFITDLSQVRRRMLAGVKQSGHVESLNVLELLKLRSPLDKGLFRKNWELIELGRTQGNRITFRLQNRTFYGPWLDQGGEIGGVPWRWPNEGNPGPVSASGKLKESMGRVWAGGKSPQSFVEGGIVNQVIFYNVQQQVTIADNIADAVIGAL